MLPSSSILVLPAGCAASRDGAVFWAFYLPTWEEFHTGVLNLGYVNGPTEGILAAVLVMALSGVLGEPPPPRRRA